LRNRENHMQLEMRMPDLATTESEIRIVRWIIQPGENVRRGQPLLEVETDKATMEVESVASGILREVCCPIDEAVSVGQVIAVLEVEGVAPHGASQAVAPEAKPEEVAAPVSTEPAVQAAGGPAGMFARNRARAVMPASSKDVIPLTVAQRVAAKRLQESKQTVPHFYLQTSVNASAMIALREAAQPVPLAWDAFFVLAVAKAIARFDRFRCRLESERLVPVESDAIGVAVDHDDELYVISVASPATKTVEQVSDAIRRSVALLRKGDPESRRIRPALLTVTNLGGCNVESFIPIVNPPESAILGVGRVLPTPVARDDGSIGVEHRCTLTLSVDHRVASGRYAGQFLGEIVRELESLGRSAS
jgi:pyruvate dehydrogenase E2 component (dihydrolipoamide acetyltransferase)